MAEPFAKVSPDDDEEETREKRHYSTKKMVRVYEVSLVGYLGGHHVPIFILPACVVIIGAALRSILIERGCNFSDAVFPPRATVAA